MHRRRALAAVGGGVAGLAGCSSLLPGGEDAVQTPTDSDAGTWPLEHYDSHNSRHTPARGPETRPEVLWRRRGVGWLPSGPRATGGIVYVGDADEETVVGIDVRTGDRLDAAPLAATRLYAGFSDSVAYGIDFDQDARLGVYDIESGERRTWADLNGRPHPWATVDGDDLFVPTGEATLAAVESDGTVRWTFERFGALRNPVVLDDLVVAASEQAVYGIDRESGVQRWGVALEAEASSPPVVSDGRVVLACDDGSARAFDREGNRLWRTDPTLEIGRSMVVDGGTVYAASEAGIVVVQNGSRTDRLSEYPDHVELLAMGGKTLYAAHGSETHKVSAVDPESGSVRWMRYLGQSIGGTLAVLDGTVLVRQPDFETDDPDELVALGEP